jgi:6-phosphogluconolactonase
LVNRAAAARLLPLYVPAHEPEEVLAELEAQIGNELPLAVVLLGMGADMHTASIFPGADRLDEALAPDAPVLIPMRAPGAPEPRITLSARVLNDALRKHVLIFGNDKLAALENAQGKLPEVAPINAVLSGATVHWAE